jgi:hypothetical protein
MLRGMRPLPPIPPARPPTVDELVVELLRFERAALVRGSVGGHVIPRVYVGVGMMAGELCVVVADRPAFAGQLPDMLLARR